LRKRRCARQLQAPSIACKPHHQGELHKPVSHLAAFWGSSNYGFGFSGYSLNRPDSPQAGAQQETAKNEETINYN